MAVLTQHKKFYEEIFRISGFLSSPFFMFGYQEINYNFDKINYRSFKGLLKDKGVKDITVLDYEDPRADIHHDMNYPFDQDTNKLHGAFKVVADVGCLEHVFNSAQAMQNCMNVVELGGLYFLHTPIAGYCKHGFHTFNPDMLLWILKNNGFKIEYCKCSTKTGEFTNIPLIGCNKNILIWIVARRIEIKDKFYVPIQDRQKIHKSYR